MERVNRNADVNHRCVWIGFLLTILALFLLVSCAGPLAQKSPAKGVYHIVKKGETVYSIARAYSISLQDLVEVNNISDVSLIKEGEVIFIPDADQMIEDVMTSAKKAAGTKDFGSASGKVSDQSIPSKPSDKPQLIDKTPLPKPASSDESGMGAREAIVKDDKLKIEEKPPAAEKKDEVKMERGKLVWPVKGTVKTRFGIQPNKAYHNYSWIKIACPVGTPVKAAAGGTVIFSSSLKNFGETIIIRHANDFTTVYTHLKKRHVKQDQNVKKGEAIAVAGEIDEAGDAFINFEIRQKGKARNPLFYLP